MTKNDKKWLHDLYDCMTFMTWWLYGRMTYVLVMLIIWLYGRVTYVCMTYMTFVTIWLYDVCLSHGDFFYCMDIWRMSVWLHDLYDLYDYMDVWCMSVWLYNCMTYMIVWLLWLDDYMTVWTYDVCLSHDDYMPVWLEASVSYWGNFDSVLVVL